MEILGKISSQYEAISFSILVNFFLKKQDPGRKTPFPTMIIVCAIGFYLKNVVLLFQYKTSSPRESKYPRESRLDPVSPRLNRLNQSLQQTISHGTAANLY